MRAQSRQNLSRLGLSTPADERALARRLEALDPMPQTQRDRQRAQSLSPAFTAVRHDLRELASQTKSLGLRHGVASYALLTAPLGTSPALRLAAALDARLSEMDKEEEEQQHQHGGGGGAPVDDVSRMQVWTDAFAELVVQARAASAEWAHVLERVYRFFTATLASMLRALHASNVRALEERCLRAEEERAAVLADLDSLRRKHADLLMQQPAAVRSDESRNATILAFIENAPGEKSRHAALGAVIGMMGHEQLAVHALEQFSEEQRSELMQRLLSPLNETAKATALAQVLDSQLDATKRMAMDKSLKTLPIRQWALLLPTATKCLPSTEATRWALELSESLEAHQLASVVEALVHDSRLQRVNSTVLAPIAVTLVSAVDPESIVELIVQAIRKWEPAQRAMLLTQMTEADAHSWSVAMIAARERAAADAAAAAGASAVEKAKAAGWAQGGKLDALSLNSSLTRPLGALRIGFGSTEADDELDGKPPLPLLITLEPSATTTTTRDWAEVVRNVVAAAPPNARGEALAADLMGADAEATPALLERALDAWGGQRASLHIAQLYRLLQEPDRLKCLQRISERWGGAELRLASAQLRHETRPTLLKAAGAPGTAGAPSRGALASGERNSDGGSAGLPSAAAGGAGGAGGGGGPVPNEAELRAAADAAGGLLPVVEREERLADVRPAGQIWLRLTPEWARLAWTGEVLATELSLRQTLQLIATLFEARALAGDSLPAEQHNSFPTFVWRWMLRTHGRRSHALANLADLLYSVQLHFKLHARVRIFAQLTGLLGEAATAEALAFVRKAYGAVYLPHTLYDSLTGDALVDANLAEATAAAKAQEAALRLAGVDEDEEEAALAALRGDDLLADSFDGSSGPRGIYSLVDVHEMLASMKLPISLDAQIDMWIQKRAEKGRPAEPLDAALGRYESTGGAEGSLNPPAGARRFATKVAAFAVDEIVELMLRAHLALRREGLRPLRQLYKEADSNGDGVLSVEEFTQLVQGAAKLSTSKRSISTDESEALFLEALRETRMHDYGTPDDMISLHAWEMIAVRHGLAQVSVDGMGLVLAPPLIEQGPKQPTQSAFTLEENHREAHRLRREAKRKERRLSGAPSTRRPSVSSEWLQSANTSRRSSRAVSPRPNLLSRQNSSMSNRGGLHRSGSVSGRGELAG